MSDLEPTQGKESIPSADEQLQALQTKLSDLEAKQDKSATAYRQLQSKADQREAILQKQVQELQEEREALTGLIEEPEKREELLRQQRDRELESLRREKRLQDAKRFMSQEYSVPSKVLEDAQNPGDVTRLTMEWLKVKAAEPLKLEPTKSEPPVSLGPGTGLHEPPLTPTKTLEDELSEKAEQTGKSTSEEYLRRGGGRPAKKTTKVKV